MRVISNKKGFMFIETIVTLTILMTVLLMLYTTFTNLLNKEKTITTYDKKGYIYSLYYAKEYLLDRGFLINLKNNVYINNNPVSAPRASLKQYVLNARDDDFLKTITFYEEIKKELESRFGIKQLEFIEVNKSGFNTSDRDDDDKFSSEFEIYEETMVPVDDTKSESVVKIVAEFYDDEIDEYFYAWIYYPNT